MKFSLQDFLTKGIAFRRKRDILREDYLNDVAVPTFLEKAGLIQIWCGMGAVTVDSNGFVISNTTGYEIEERVDIREIKEFLLDLKKPPPDLTKGVKINTERVTKKVTAEIDKYLERMKK